MFLYRLTPVIKRSYRPVHFPVVMVFVTIAAITLWAGLPTGTAQPLTVYGQTWHIDYRFVTSQLVSPAQLNEPLGVMLFGLLAVVLVTVVVWLAMRSRTRDLRLQKEQDVELAKDELLSLASHQLRTPATGVKQYLGMVLQGFAGEVPEQQQALLQKAYASNDRQLRIINEILHLAKLNAGRIILARKPVNLKDLLSDIVSEQQPDIQAARHSLHLQLPKRTVVVDADAHMLRMAIENLLSNAIKYTPPGGNITVSLHRQRTGGRISVRDNGVGIAEADFGKLFQQFSRLSNDMSLRTDGIGVGLYLAKHLVELHGGRVEVTSQPGTGSEFRIELPG